MTFAASQLAPRESIDLHDLVEQIGTLLPEQAPIRRFVHHNTLHSFEHLNFEEAVVEAARLFDCEPFPTEAFFAEQWKQGRITRKDLEAVVPRSEEKFPVGDWTRREFQLLRLSNFLPHAEPAQVRYQMTEGAGLEKFYEGVPEQARELLGDCGPPNLVLAELWKGLSAQCSPRKIEQPNSQKELLDTTIHPLIIRFCGVYLDQGIAYWPLIKSVGFYETFLSLFSQPAGPVLPWMKGLATRLARQRKENWNAARALESGLRELGVPERDWEETCLKCGLALRGWAGMVRQLEVRPDRAPIKAPPCRLMDYLAVYVQLEAHLLSTRQTKADKTFPRHEQDLSLLYEAFLLAQVVGLMPQGFSSPEQYRDFLNEVARFHELERRKLLFQAYEHHYLVSVLDALKGHHEQGEYERQKSPRFQAVFCIDDREESLRRHLEEICPESETFGYAGFYNVPMNYQSLDDVHSRPLCPVSIQPRHLVKEVTTDEYQATKRAGRMKPVGYVAQSVRAHRTGMAGGLFLNSVTGLLAGIPLIGKTLFPGLARHLSHAVEKNLIGQAPTRLLLERAPDDEPNEDGYLVGFTLDEMTEIIEQAMKTMGAVELSPLFIVVGHGSSSLNNPHEAAHDCGATGGGRGGPNARAFSAMANHPEVRAKLKEKGFEIPQQTWFLGAYHNTCDDTIEYYDVDLVPEHLAGEVKEAQAALHRACVLDAHERCRRFENVPLSYTPEQAYRHVLARSEQLAQPRPEYGHCTNSLCLVGRRDRSRGVFLDRRAFLVSYDPELDQDGEILGGLLQSVGPVGAGINLEYYFSAIDKAGYGCGTKLPHNVSGLIGVMDGYSSDLRTGLPWQMVEVHEPMRLLNIVEAEPDTLKKILSEKPGLRALIDRGWIWVVAQSPSGGDFWVYRNGRFEPYQTDNAWIETVDNSMAHYQGKRGHLPCAQIRAGLRQAR
jgi:uncharacterized protein